MAREVGIAGWAIAGLVAGALAAFWGFTLFWSNGWWGYPGLGIAVWAANGLAIFIGVVWAAGRRSRSMTWRVALAGWLVVGVLGIGVWVTWQLQWVRSYETYAGPVEDMAAPSA